MGMVYYYRMSLGVLYKSVVDCTVRSPIDIGGIWICFTQKEI